VTRDLEVGKPEVRVRVDRDRAADAGVAVRDIALAVSALMGGQDVGDYVEGGRSYDIRLRLIPQHRELPEDVGRIWVRSRSGRLVDAGGLLSLEIGVGPSVVTRTDRQRSATVYAKLDGKVLGDALPEVRAIAAQVLPEGYGTRFAGRAETFAETRQGATFALALAVLLTYLVLAFQFESFTQPLAIMTGLPLAFVGAFGLLLLYGNTINMFSLMGLILLVGIATKNGILLVDFANQIRARGYRVDEALVEAGATRLRPILMTAVSTIAGVVPVVLGFGIGSESRQPLAVAITGGIISSTVLTLVVVPVAYSYLERLGNVRFVGWWRRRVFVPDPEEESPAGERP
jgi:HAE1 family hydrophobic/amphiphilic exporter-1